MTPRLRAVLRGVAIAIATAGVVDPVFSIERAPASPVTVVDMTDGAVDPIVTAIRERISAAVIERTPAGVRIPCAPGSRCVIVADGTVMAELPEDVEAPVLIVSREPAAPNVRVLSVTVAAPHAFAASVARIELEGRGVTGQHTTMRIRDGEATVGSAGHPWKSDDRVMLDVPWWPTASGARVLRVEAVTNLAETTTADNTVDLAVHVADQRLPVLVFDTRPSWGSTFVRRALEDDPRFMVEHRARVAPNLALATPAGRLDARALDYASVLIVGAPDGLTENETALIDRFVRVRGGTAILLPDRRPSGPGARLFRSEWGEQLTAEPQPIGALRATEILHSTDVPVGSTVLGRAGDRAAVVMMPAGEGALIVSGAMDAWRFREHEAAASPSAGTSFDRFWRTVTAQAASASASLLIEFNDAVAAPGTRQQFRVRRRSMQAEEPRDASAVVRCDSSPKSSPAGAAAEPVRLWPDATPGTFAGEIAIGPVSSCVLEVAVGESRAISGIAVTDVPAVSTLRTLDALERRVLAAGGSIAAANDLETMTMVNHSLAPVRVPVHPMRSPWWILPFTLCLAAEWWMRRRSGLR